MDEAGWPVVKLVYPRTPAKDAALRYDEMLRAFGRRRIAYWLIVDICKLDPLSVSASDRAKLASVIDEATRAHPDTLQGVAVVSDSRVLRMFYTAHVWMRRHKPYPLEVFANLEDAAVWVSQIRGVGRSTVPPAKA